MVCIYRPEIWYGLGSGVAITMFSVEFTIGAFAINGKTAGCNRIRRYLYSLTQPTAI